MATLGHDDRFNARPAPTTGSSPELVAVIRDAIVRDIIEGRYPRGARLPTNPQIQERWQVSARTSRKVLALLTEEGWAIAEGTRGYTSTGGPPPASPYTPPAYRPAYGTPQGPAPSAGTAVPSFESTVPDPKPATGDQPAAPQAAQAAPTMPPPPPMPRPVHTVAIGADIPATLSAVHLISAAYEPAPPPAAHALHLNSPGLPVMVRRRLITDPTGHIPLELRTSYTPGIPEDSPLAQPATLPGTWAENLTAHTPHQPATATSQITTRRPTEYEAPTLQLPPGAYVLVRATTTHTHDGTPIDHTVSVWPETTTIHAERHPLT